MTDGQTNVTKLIVAFRNFANALGMERVGSALLRLAFLQGARDEVLALLR